MGCCATSLVVVWLLGIPAVGDGLYATLLVWYRPAESRIRFPAIGGQRMHSELA
jgi:hypothetical protein